ncbi:hypothetical protein [Serratia sp. Se-RSBMAAmG]|uniref:hypothetical protein n=1 Tax=Serratia sp. Se-RSBMAAmG TaxID=3043305 RepID=UPI0024AF5B46|nr:hypothetical protein [Serratia sp. Se-RSBMAAmG]MDI6976146.1 hypothetical protein [Serratia sp. Se-RSBMAAmG]
MQKVLIAVCAMMLISVSGCKSDAKVKPDPNALGYLVCFKQDGSINSYYFEGNVMGYAAPTSTKLSTSFKDMDGNLYDTTMPCIMKYTNKQESKK